MRAFEVEALVILAGAVARAQEHLERELRNAFPVGARIKVRAQSNHQHASDVEVVSVSGLGDGSIRVKYPGGHVQSVSWRSVVSQ